MAHAWTSRGICHADKTRYLHVPHAPNKRVSDAITRRGIAVESVQLDVELGAFDFHALSALGLLHMPQANHFMCHARQPCAPAGEGAHSWTRPNAPAMKNERVL